MKGEILLQNVFYLFIIAIIIESCIMAVFSMTSLKEIADSKPVQTARDVVILLLSVVLCYKVSILTIFGGTGIHLPKVLDIIISALVLTRMTIMIKDFFDRLRNS